MTPEKRNTLREELVRLINNGLSDEDIARHLNWWGDVYVALIRDCVMNHSHDNR